MTTIQNLIPRTQPVRAMRIILGTTTRTEIREFCPGANVGVLHKDGVDHEKDIRWVWIPNGGGQSSEMMYDGDWLVELPDLGFRILRDAEVHAGYVVQA